MPGPNNNPTSGSTPAAKPPDSSGLTGVSAAAAQFPAFGALMNIPEVAALLNEAANGGWSQDQFTLHLMATNWWKSKSDTERVWEATKLSDPAKAAQQKRNMFAQVSTEAQLMGVVFDTNQLNFITEGAIAGGWSADQLKAAIAGNAQQNKDRPGTISATQTALQGVADAYGVPVSHATTFDWAKRVAQGTADQSTFAEYARGQAKISHPYWEKQLDQGLTVRQLADPYVQQAARLLEVDPSTISLSDPKWDFTSTDKAGARTPLSQTDWSHRLMTDQRFGWDKTSNAKDAAYQVVDQLRTTFGAK